MRQYAAFLFNKFKMSASVIGTLGFLHALHRAALHVNDLLLQCYLVDLR
jgi:hypothetical protein